MGILILILKIIGLTLLSSVLMCSIYLFRSIILGIDLDIFKDNLRKNIIFHVVIGAIIAWAIMIYNFLKHGHI